MSFRPVFKINEPTQLAIKEHFGIYIKSIEPLEPVNGEYEFQRDVTITFEFDEKHNYRLTCIGNRITKTVTIKRAKKLPASPVGEFNPLNMIKSADALEELLKEN